MPTELEQQLPRFAEALDREAPAISFDEILSRGTVAVDVNRLEQPSSDQVPPVVAVPWGEASWGEAMPRYGENGERDTSLELATVAARPPARHRVALKVALAVAAAAVLVVALGAIVRTGDEPDPADVPTSTVPTPPPTTMEPARSGGMWPQSTLEEVQAAQELADAGDAAYTWQVDPKIVEDDLWIGEGHQVELVDRFLREVLGWEAYMLNPRDGMVRNGYYDTFYDQRYLRCAPGRTNPLYPPGPEPEWGELCAPTIDDLHYESVSLYLAQLDRQGSDGIWVVNRWDMQAPFAQADPAVVEAQATERLEEFLAARIAGERAEGHVQVDPAGDIPLLYATTSGAPFERYEIERVDGQRWPDGDTTFTVRLFADGDATVVEQTVSLVGSDGLRLEVNSTTENDEPVVLSHTSTDGEVTISAPSTWGAWLPGTFGVPVAEGEVVHEDALDVWSGSLWLTENGLGSGERIELVDPVAYDAWCAANGGSPLLSAPADAASIAQQLVADPNFETTAPVAARIGGVEALSIDVALAPGGETCGIGIIDISRWIHALWEPGWRLRLYLVDLPDGMSAETLAITVVAPEEYFEDVIAETAPIIDSIEFHPG